VDRVGCDTEVIRRYIQDQEKEEGRLDQLEMAFDEEKPTGSI